MNRWLRWRNPPLFWRAVAVGAVFAAPGALAGEMIGLLTGAWLASTVLCGVLAAIAGGVLEARRS